MIPRWDVRRVLMAHHLVSSCLFRSHGKYRSAGGARNPGSSKEMRKVRLKCLIEAEKNCPFDAMGRQPSDTLVDTAATLRQLAIVFLRDVLVGVVVEHGCRGQAQRRANQNVGSDHVARSVLRQ